MRNTINKVAAIVKSIFTLTAFSFIALVFYNDIKTPFGVFLSVLIFIIGIILSYKVCQYIMRRGILEAMTENASSSDMDQLVSTGLSDFKEISALDLASSFENDTILTQARKIRIWGDWNQRGLDVSSKIKSMQYNKVENSIMVEFDNLNQITIWNPSIIHEATSYLKIIKASKIKWEWNNKEKFQVYKFTPKGIKSFTNSNWKIHELDTSLSKPAIYLQ